LEANSVPRGGKRRGAGRKKGYIAERSRAVADEIAESGRTPLAYMLRIMEDVTADPARRDEMARSAAPFVHPKLSSVTTSNVNTNFNGGDVNFVQIFAIPHGALIDQSGKVVIDGEAVEISSIEPYAGTPGLPAPIDAPAPIEPPLPVVEVDTTNVTVLRKRDEP
jgi:hypothetical protein